MKLVLVMGYVGFYLSFMKRELFSLLKKKKVSFLSINVIWLIN